MSSLVALRNFVFLEQNSEVASQLLTIVLQSLPHTASVMLVSNSCFRPAEGFFKFF